MTSRDHRLRDLAVPMGTTWLLNDVAEAKGKQELYTRQSPQVLEVLREMAGLVLTAIREQPGAFRLADIEQACPGVGREWIRSLLTELKAAGEATCQGKGPAARWRFLGSQGTNS